MTRITDLPEEIIVMIIRRLDFPSVCNLFMSSKFFSDLIKMPGVVQECNMSRNLASTAHITLKDVFKAVSNHLLVLNMCGVADITKARVLPAFKKLKRLKVLDISFTDINLIDFIAIYSVCPTLKDITMDFKIAPETLSEDIVQKLQSIFENFENVHFLGAISNLLISISTLNVLKKSKLNRFKLSVVEADDLRTTIITDEAVVCEMPHFNHFATFLLVNWKSVGRYDHISNFPIISLIDLKNHEFCIIYTMSRHRHIVSVCASPLLAKFFKDYFDITTRTDSEYSSDPKGNVALLVWNRQTTRFDGFFFQDLYCRVKAYFPFFHEAFSAAPCPQNIDWIYTNPRPAETMNVDSDDELQEKKRKTLMPSVLLDYDHLLRDKKKAELSIIFIPDVIVCASLPSYGQYYSKLTFLSLSGAVKYSADFFSNIFVWCQNLATLSVEFMAITASRYSYDIIHGIQASRSMKNLRLVDKGMDLKQFFNALSKCKTLENIHLLDTKQWDHSEIADPMPLVESCANLYSVYIEASFAERSIGKQLLLFNKAKIRNIKPHLRVEITTCSNIGCLYRYDPYVEVFRLNAIKPI